MRSSVFVFLALATPVFGQLKWDNPEQTLKPKSLDKQVIAKYRFTNTGTSQVTIEGVKTSCGCTTAALEKKEYAPGESGEIEAKFEIGGRTGHQEKSILVTTSFAPAQPTVLRLVVDIPEALKIEPELVLWHLGDRISVPDEIPGKILSVQSNNPAVKLELREVRAGSEAGKQPRKKRGLFTFALRSSYATSCLALVH